MRTASSARTVATGRTYRIQWQSLCRGSHPAASRGPSRIWHNAIRNWRFRCDNNFAARTFTTRTVSPETSYTIRAGPVLGPILPPHPVPYRNVPPFCAEHPALSAAKSPHGTQSHRPRHPARSSININHGNKCQRNQPAVPEGDHQALRTFRALRPSCPKVSCRHHQSPPSPSPRANPEAFGAV